MLTTYEVERNDVDMWKIAELVSWEDALDAVDVFKLLSWDIEYLVWKQHREEATT